MRTPPRLTKQQCVALARMERGGRAGESFGGRHLAMIRRMRYAGLCEPLWMGEAWWRVTSLGLAALEESDKERTALAKAEARA